MTMALPLARQGPGATISCLRNMAGKAIHVLLIAGVMLLGLTTIVTAQTPAQSVTGQITIEWKKPVKLSISPSELHPGKEGDDYEVQFVGNDGTGPYSFSAPSDALPPGLALTVRGKLTGKPQKAGGYAIAVTAKDAEGNTGVRNYSISIAKAQVKTGRAPCPEGQVRFGADCVIDRTKTPVPVTPPTVTARPPVSPPLTPTTTALYPREVQANLSDLGCLKGRVDGIWGDGSTTALQDFSKLPGSGLPRNSGQPTQAALNATSRTSAPKCRPVYAKPKPTPAAPSPTPTPAAPSPTPQGPPTCTVKNAEYDSGRRGCVCKQGFEADNGQCVRPKPKTPTCKVKNAIYDANRGGCVCRPGYEPQGGNKCVRPQSKPQPQPQPQPQPKSCTGGSYPDGRGGCRCEGSVMVYQNGKCVRPNSGSSGGGGGGMSKQQCAQTCLAVGVACMKETGNLAACKARAAQCTQKYGCPEAM